MLARRFNHVTLDQRTAPDAIRQPLTAYLSGEDIAAVEHIPVHTTGTRLQQQVWKALRAIPAGMIRSYADLARTIGQPVREVVLACARNPVAIIVPCHRLTDSDGKLAAYVGGLARKQWLLRHEGALAPENVDSGESPLALPALRLGGNSAAGWSS